MRKSIQRDNLAGIFAAPSWIHADPRPLPDNSFNRKMTFGLVCLVAVFVAVMVTVHLMLPVVTSR